MSFSVIIEYLLFLAVGIYLAGSIVVLFFEYRISCAFRSYRKISDELGGRGMSMAVFHAKMFAVEIDYQTRVDGMERKRNFILEKVLFLRKSTLKNKSDFHA